MVTFEIGISSITPNEEDSNVRWTGETIQAKDAGEASRKATDRGFYRNVRIRQVERD